MDILTSPSFFKTVTVIGVIAATVVLSLAGRLEGNRGYSQWYCRLCAGPVIRQ